MISVLAREQILELPAGRALDQLVAERVMAEEPCHCWMSLNTGPRGECEKCGRPSMFYSQRIDAAFEVVDRMAAKVRGLVLEDWRGDDTAPGWWAAYFCLPDGGTSSQAVADTASLAICRAALLSTLEKA